MDFGPTGAVEIGAEGSHGGEDGLIGVAFDGVERADGGKGLRPVVEEGGDAGQVEDVEGFVGTFESNGLEEMEEAMLRNGSDGFRV